MKKVLVYFFTYFLFTFFASLAGHYLIIGFIDGFNSETIELDSLKFASIAALILSIYLTYLELRKEKSEVS
jgi:hypothetical protein